MHTHINNNSALLYDTSSKRWLLFSDPIAVYMTTQREELVPLLDAVERRVLSAGCFAAGFLSYEAAAGFDPAFRIREGGSFPLLWFGVYAKPVPLSLSFFQQPSVPAKLFWQPSVSEAQYKHALQKIKEYIRIGHSYQVNYSFRLQSPLCFDPWDFFSQMMCAQGQAYGAFLQTEDWFICSASPELFFRLHGDQLVSRPMKGTTPRGLWFADDQARAAALKRSDKDWAENAMIVDMVRNDLGRIAQPGQVRLRKLFALEQYPTLWQMTSEVRCKTKANVTEIFKALFPPASVTGAPKPRTVGIIAELESSPRNVYTGAIGFLGPRRKAQFNVAIRTLQIDRQKKQATYGVGSGIVWDSRNASEWNECRIKGNILNQRLPEFSLLETMLWTLDEGCFLLEYHLQRLRDSAAYFGYPVDWQEIRHGLSRLTGGLSPDPHRVRLLVDRHGKVSWEIQVLAKSKQSCRVCLAKSFVDISDPFLYHKTTWRKMYAEAKKACTGYDDVLLWNARGELTEATIANIVVELDGQLFTPPIACGLLGGTYRALLLEQAKIKERVVFVRELRQCTRIYLINSVYKFVEARRKP